MSELLGLAGFTFVASVTPGPNNTLLWGVGDPVRVRRTAGHVAGTAVGVGLLLLAMAAGVGALLTAVPGADLALKLAGSAYLLVLAWRIARSRGLLAGAAFQFANPKAWLFALAAVGTFQPRDLPPAAAALTVAGLCAVLALVLAASVAFIWAQERRAGSIERSVGKMAPTGD